MRKILCRGDPVPLTGNGVRSTYLEKGGGLFNGISSLGEVLQNIVQTLVKASVLRNGCGNPRGRHLSGL